MHSLFGNYFFPGLGEPKTCDETGCVGEEADDSGGVAELPRGCAAWHVRHDAGRDQGCGCSQHPPSHIRRKAFTGAAQVSRIERWQIISPKTELGDGYCAKNENSPGWDCGIPHGWKQDNQRDQQQPGNLKNVQQALSAKNKNRKNRHQDTPKQTPHFLNSLQCTHNLLLVRVSQNFDPGGAGNDAGKMLKHPEGSRVGAGHHETTQESRLAKFRVE